MFFVHVIILLLGGVLGAASLIVAKKPDAKEVLDKLTPYQGTIGIILLVMGIIGLIDVISSLGLFKLAPFFFIVWILAVVTEIGLGFLLGFALIAKYVLSKNEQAMEKGEALRAKLAAFQGPIGVVGIVLAVLLLILRFTM